MQPRAPITYVFGLGNPGVQYAKTFHNAGLLALDFSHERFDMPRWKQSPKKSFLYATHESFTLIKSQVFMNESGIAALEAKRLFRFRPEELLVLHDDSDLPLGEARFSFGRGSGGHHGIDSLISTLRTKEFWRLRIGVRTTKEKASEFVLKPLRALEEKKLQRIFSGTIEKVIENASLPPSSRFTSVSGKLTP